MQADPDKAREDGETPLMIAAENDHLDVVSALLQGGADVNRVDEDGATALFIAAEHGPLRVFGLRHFSIVLDVL